MPSNDQGLLGLSEAELDLPVYRIYRLERFEALLRTGKDALVSPARWDDPFENFMLSRTSVLDQASGQQIQLGNLSDDWYGQCWSLQAESDAMWRIYSPDKNHPGVKVRSSIGRLYENLKRVGPSTWPMQFWVGKVKYHTRDEIKAAMSSMSFTDVILGGQGRGFAELLCVKREAFLHEQEVRLLFQDMELPDPIRSRLGGSGAFTYDLDANAIFSEAVLDPRLEDVDFHRHRRSLEQAGCAIQITKSDLYEVPRFTIPM